MGADVAELDLGQSEDPKKLVHGSPGKLRSTAGHLADFRRAFENVGNGLKTLVSWSQPSCRRVQADSLLGSCAIAALSVSLTAQPVIQRARRRLVASG